jgi:RNA polymerase sigma factor (TIGR02999 family)
MAPPSEVTLLLQAWTCGDRGALDRLMPLVYDELKRMAHHHLARERKDRALPTTALVHETYLKLVDQRRAQWRDRAQFFGVAARMMRRILVDQARARRAVKRGSDASPFPLDEASLLPGASGRDVLDLDEALTRLADLDARQGRVVELRFFGGLSVEEAAQVLDVSPATVKREWAMAKAWLYRELGGAEA